MATDSTAGSEVKRDLAEIKRKLAWRMGFAGLMIFALLGGLAMFDRLSVRNNEPESTAPHFTEPVPVAKKSVTQPVTPAEPTAPPAPEASAAPIDKSAPALREPPPRPEVSAQPVLPRASAPASAAARPSPAAPATGKSGESRLPAGAAVARAEPAQPAVQAPGPAPRPLFGYALQAGVFADPRRAEELHAKLTLEGIPSTIEARVQAGPFKSREEAEATRARLKALGIDTVLLVPKGVKR